MFYDEMISYQDKLYYVYRRIKENRIKEEGISDLKEFWHCDIVLKEKKQESSCLLFLIEIPEIQVIE